MLAWAVHEKILLRLGILLHCGIDGASYWSHADQRAATTLTLKPHNGGTALENTVLVFLIAFH